MEKITRAQMALIRSLATAKGRRETGLFVAEGPKLVQELLEGGLQCELMVTCGENAAETMKQMKETKPMNGELCVNASPRDFERISQLKTPQGVMGIFRIPCQDNIPDASSLVLALDGVQDPGNMGTILRLADWFGVTDVVCSQDCASAWQPKVIQASMGALARVHVHRTDNLAAWLQSLPQGTSVFGTFLDGEPLQRTPNPTCGVIVMGNEGNGITPAVAATVTNRVLIPCYPPGRKCVESLNVATATAIILAHMRDTY